MSKLDDLFWPYPFKGTGPAMGVNVIGSLENPKVYAPGLSALKQQIKDLILQIGEDSAADMDVLGPIVAEL